MSSQPLDTAERLEQTAKRATAALTDVSSKTFDYVIVGGGTSGLTLASRLAEDPNVTVVVLETGGEMQIHDSIIMPAQYGREHGNAELVYPHETVIQPSIGRSIPWARGRGLGGTSAINFLVFQKPPAADIEAWERLGSHGWNWARYHAAVKRAENFWPPSKEQVESFDLTFDEGSFGTGGPIQHSYPKVMTGGEQTIKKAFLNLGVRATPDPAGGDIRGFATFPNSVDPRTNTRSFSAIGYFLEKPDRPNLKVLTFATARRVIFKEDSSMSDGKERLEEAEGVEFEYNGATHIVKAKHEVILAAGALRSSSLLELSGIGNKTILEPLGIKTRIHNPAVGENVQEHSIAAVTWETNKEKFGFETLDQLTDPAVAEKHVKLYSEGKGLFLSHINCIGWLPLSDITSPARTQEIISAEEARIAEDLASKPLPGLREQYEIQLENLRDPEAVDAEFIVVPFYFPSPTAKPQPGKTYISLICGINHPFSRGSIHIKSADPHAAALMDPNVFGHAIDLEIMVDMFKYSRKVAATAPFKDIIVEEVNPGPAAVTDEEIRDAIKASVGSTWHTAGACAMQPQDKGGVVDSSLKVYGTKNLRVGDISIIPLHIAAHTQTTAYAIGEQLADILKAEKA